MLQSLPALEKIESHPAVIHVPESASAEQHEPLHDGKISNLNIQTGPSMIRKKRQGCPFIFIVIVLVAVALLSMWMDYFGELEYGPPQGILVTKPESIGVAANVGVGTGDNKFKKFQPKNLKSKYQDDMPQEQKQRQENQQIFEDFGVVDADSNFDEGTSEENDDVFGGSFTFWGQQANRLNEFDPKTIPDQKKLKKRKGAKRGEKLRPFPVISETDDHVPQGAAGSVMRAADALLCKESVVDYVINATDLRDECGGLKKAFTKHCADDSPDVSPKRRGRRRLLLSLEDEPIEKTPKDNPVLAWKIRINQVMRDVGNFPPRSDYLDFWKWQAMQRQFHVGNGRKMVALNEAEQPDYSRMAAHMNPRGQRHRLEGSDPDDPEDEFIANDVVPLPRDPDAPEPRGNVDATQTSTHAPMTTQNTTEAAHLKEKPKVNLALPTNLVHVSEKMLSETLMLQQEDKIIASVKAAQNATNTTKSSKAAVKAAESAKAVGDAVDYVSSVLNDPTSVEARTCCTSILNVFHETCSVDEEEELSDRRLFIVVVVIALCGLVKSLIRHFQIRWLPEAAGCILVGVASGWGLSYYPHHDISFDGIWFLRIMVPPIVFEAALSIDKRSFNRHFIPIMIYAVLGTLMATAITAIVVHKGTIYFHRLCETIPFTESLTFGALISSIDPIAVLSVLSNMGMTDTDTIYVVIFGESLLNDGVAIVLFQTLVHFLDDNMTVDTQAVVAAAVHFLVVAVGSFLVGIASGICCTVYYWVMHGCQTPLVEVLMFCCWALLPYYICDGIEWSGIVAVVAAGFVMDINVVGQHNDVDQGTSPEQRELQQSPTSGRPGHNRREHRRRPIFSKEGHLSNEAKTHIGFVTEIIATMMETAIFAYLGLFLFSSRYHWNFYHTAIAITGCCVSRAIMIPTLSTLANSITRMQQVSADCRAKHLPQQHPQKSDKPAFVVVDKKMQLVLWFAGLRGAMSFALVENIPLYDPVTGEGTAFKSELKAMTCASIIFTVFVLGGCTYYMMDGLGMAPNATSSDKKRSIMENGAETEAIGLLQKRDDATVEVDDDESQWDDKSETELYKKNPSRRMSPSGGVRQRLQVM